MKWSSQNIIWQHISKQPDFIPQIAGWFQDEWGALDPDCTMESRYEELKARIDPSLLPLTIIATVQDELLGTYSLDLSDLAIRPNLSPWLASVFVNPKYRNQGIGTLLVQEALRHAHRMGIHTLYLFTVNLFDWYASMGFEAIEEVFYQGETLTIMRFTDVHSGGNK